MVRREGLRDRKMAVALPVALVVAVFMLMGLGSSPAHADATFTVNSAGDENDTDFPGGIFDNSSDGKCDVDSGTSGDRCTLRAAIQEANVTAGADTIEFNIPGSGVHTISPTLSLPQITEAVSIDGYSQPGATPNTLVTGTDANLLIELNGTNANTGHKDGLFIRASNTVVKGLVINRFQNNGIGIFQKSTQELLTNVRIEGNFIGTNPSGTFDSSGTIDFGNTFNGVDLFATSDSTVGGTSLAARNLISGNGFHGVYISSDSLSGFAPSTNNTVEGNLIGAESDGASALSNDGSGVAVFGDTSTGNRILSNSILFNRSLGIDLGSDNSTPNDLGDADVGPNNLQNFPVLTSATTSRRRGTTIKGTLNSRPGATYTIQFFSNPQGTNEGATLIGQKTSVPVDGSGNASFAFKPKTKVRVGQAITATATNESTGDTSEFSVPPVGVRRAR